MIARPLAAFSLVAVALSLVLLLGTTERASGETWKVHYNTALSCAGDDGSAVNTTLSGNFGIGVTQITVTNATGIVVDRFITIGGATTERDKVLSVVPGAPPTIVNLYPPGLSSGHSNLDPVTTTADDSCAAGTANNPGSAADITSTFQVNSTLDRVAVAEAACGADTVDDDADTRINDGCAQVGGAPEAGDQCANGLDDAPADGAVNDGCPPAAPKHSNFATIRTLNTPPEWAIERSSGVADGTLRGRLVTTVTLSILNGACTTITPVNIPLFDATTNTNNMVGWVGDGDNLVADPDNNGFPAYIDKYPSYLKGVTDPDAGIVAQSGLMPSMKPVVRLAGHQFVTSGAPASKLEFLIFDPGALALGKSPYPDRDLGDSYGYINAVVLDSPEPGSAAISAITDFCEPLSTNTTLYGKTQGKGVINPLALGGPSFDVPDAGKCDANPANPLCGTVVQTNPAGNSGIWGGDTHLTGAWGIGNRDADGDGINNNEDGCPLHGINDGCLVKGAAETGGQCNNHIDDDGDTNINDGCPAIGTAEDSSCVNDVDDDADTNVNDGCPAKDAAENSACVNDVDDDATDDPNDRVNDGCPLKGSFADCDFNPADGDCDDPNEAVLCQEAVTGVDDDGDTRVNDGCPINGSLVENPSCADAVDSDADTRVNDGCLVKGTAENPSCTDAFDSDPVNDGSTSDIDADGVEDVCDSNDTTPTVDMDGDGFHNRQDNCPLVNNPSQADSDEVPASDGGGGDGIGDACEPNDLTSPTEGAFGVDFVRDALCLGLDTDGDGWCDDAETKAGSNPAVAPAPPLPAGASSQPEYRGLSPALAGPPAAPGVCSDLGWYVTTGDGSAAGAGIDNDGDTQINAGDANCAALAGDTDADGVPDLSTPAVPLTAPVTAGDVCVTASAVPSWVGTGVAFVVGAGGTAERRSVTSVSGNTVCFGTTVTVASAGGASTVTVANTTAMYVGELIAIGGETGRRIVSISGNVVTLSSSLASPHPIGDKVTQGGQFKTQPNILPLNGHLITETVQFGDSCRVVYNPEQLNTDGDAVQVGCLNGPASVPPGCNTGGDACDLDADGDGYTSYLESLYGGLAKNGAHYYQAGMGLDFNGDTITNGNDTFWYAGALLGVPAVEPGTQP